MITIPHRYEQTDRQTDGQLGWVIPLNAMLRAVRALGFIYSTEPNRKM